MLRLLKDVTFFKRCVAVFPFLGIIFYKAYDIGYFFAKVI